MPWAYLAGSLALLGLGVALVVFGLKRARLARAVAAAPTQKARSAAMGKAELKGLARALAQPLAGPFSGAPCVWFRFTVEEERVSHDSKGHERRSWAQVAAGHSSAPFDIEDSTGWLRVDPQGAEMQAPKMLSYTSGRLSFGTRPTGPRVAEFLGAAGLGMLFGARRRLCEWRLDVDRPIYALGVLRPRRLDASQDPLPVLGRGEHGEAFLISTNDEAQILNRLRWASFGLWFLGLLLGLASAWVARHGGLI